MYTAKSVALMPIGTVTVSDLTAAAVAQRFIATSKVIIKRVMISIQTATVSNANIVVTPKKRPTPGSAVGEVLGSTIIIPTAIVAGSVYYKTLAAPITLNPGQELAFEVTTAAAGGGAAGTGWCFPSEVEESPETAANITSMIASA